MHILLAVALTIAYPFTETTVARPDVQGCFSHLFRAAYFGRANYERAAFLVLQHDGSVACHDWPPSFSYRSERWNGAVPDGTIAIAHTHPLTVRRPSPEDLKAAAAVGVPVFVVTDNSIAMATPDGRVLFYAR